MEKYIPFCVLILIAISCKRPSGNDAYTPYIIKQGDHNSVTRVAIFNKEELRFIARFNNSAIYSTKDTNNQGDINKLYGYSDCGSTHQQNSARFGWRWYNNKLEILAYCYVAGKWSYKYLTSVNLNQDYEYTLRIKNEIYEFNVNGVTETMARGCADGGIKYHLFPYFGGNETAPHDIQILIKDL